ncbi:MAG: bifunctional serine/threonine-protein kinase/formylglycine-generating enzyme family protein [Phycisphaerales bacterium JB059]
MRDDRVKGAFGDLASLPPERWESALSGRGLSEEERAQTLRLLRRHAEGSSFLESPAFDRFQRVTSSIGQEVADFTIEREIGRGGMGVVYLAHDSVLDRRVALKILLDSALGSARALVRFQQEARAAARLTHPSIVQIYRSGKDAGAQYIAMEYVSGGTLAERMPGAGRGGAVPAERALTHETTEGLHRSIALLAEVADALEYAHKHGVVHRDVKPSNILLDERERPKLGDFGIAMIVSNDRLTNTGETPGSVHYMSPEQASVKGARVDHRTDIFSLGVVLYELLSGQRPFSGSTTHQILHAVREQTPRPLRSVNRRVSRDLAVICHKMLEKRPADRYPSAGHVSAELRSVLEGKPILARPPNLLRRASRLAVKRKGTVATVGVGALLCVLGGVLWLNHALWLRHRVRVEFTTGTPGAAIYAQRVDPETLAPHEPERVGSTPMAPTFEPGAYRFTLVDAGGGFVEFDRFLRAGESVSIRAAPRASAETREGMVYVPGGTYRLGRPGAEGLDGDRRVQLDAFWIDATEVSNEAYLAYCAATGAEWPYGWREFGYDEALSAHPVVGLTHAEMQAYAAWAGKRLPTSDEWEAAARFGHDGLLPWPESTTAPEYARPELEHFLLEKSYTLADEYRLYTERARPVEAPPEARTALGLSYVFGNVEDATSTRHPLLNHRIVTRGGGLTDIPTGVTLATIRTALPDLRPSMRVGFRCARTDRPPHLEETLP